MENLVSIRVTMSEYELNKITPVEIRWCDTQAERTQKEVQQQVEHPGRVIPVRGYTVITGLMLNKWYTVCTWCC